MLTNILRTDVKVYSELIIIKQETITKQEIMCKTLLRVQGLGAEGLGVEY